MGETAASQGSLARGALPVRVRQLSHVAYGRTQVRHGPVAAVGALGPCGGGACRRVAAAAAARGRAACKAATGCTLMLSAEQRCQGMRSCAPLHARARPQGLVAALSRARLKHAARVAAAVARGRMAQQVSQPCARHVWTAVRHSCPLPLAAARGCGPWSPPLRLACPAHPHQARRQRFVLQRLTAAARGGGLRRRRLAQVALLGFMRAASAGWAARCLATRVALPPACARPPA
jgi:hypothetical protein